MKKVTTIGMPALNLFLVHTKEFLRKASGAMEAFTDLMFFKKSHHLFKPIFFLLLLLSTLSNVFATDYYVSNSSGSDTYNGLAGTFNGTNGPWKTLTKVSSITFSAGDRIFLKTGDTWISQTLLLKGLGSSANPITLSTYGTAAKPIISPRIIDAYAITIKNTGGWKVLGVEIEKARAGIALQYDNSYNNDYIFIDNCNIHDIDDTYNSTPNLYNHISSGILLEGNGTTLPYHLTNLTVQNITFNNVNCSWWVGCIAAYTNSSGFGSNSRFRYITVNNMNATNGKQWGYSFLFLEDAAITNADCDNTGFGTNPYGACGTLVAYSKRVVLDGCDIRNSKRGPQPYDGAGFDFEGGTNTSDVTFKNAIVDSSDGCGIFVFNNSGTGGTPNLLLENVTVSNFGLNPGNTSAGIDFSSAGNSSGIIRNNTIIRPNTSVAFYTGYPAIPANFTFTNNTFSEAGTLPPTAGNIAPNATVTASTTDVGNGYATTKANDNNTADFTGWASTVGAPQWLEFTWASAQTIDKIELYTTNNYFLKDYDVQYWNGTAWTTVASVRNNAQKQVNSSFTAVSSTKLRIYCITADQTSYCRIDELKVFGTPPPTAGNIAPNATVTASTTDVGNGYATIKANDNNTADFTGWASTVGAPQWLEFTWSSAQTIDKIELYTTNNYFLKDYDVQYWNGTAWTTVASVRNNAQKQVNTSFTAVSTLKMRIYCITADQTSYCRIDELKIFSVGGSSNVCTWVFAANENGTATFTGTKQVRYGANGIYFTLTATNSIGCNNTVFGDPVPGVVKTCEVCNTSAGSTNLALNKTYSSSSNWDASQEAAKAFDGSQSTNWQAQNGSFANQWLSVDFGTSTSFNKVVLSEYGDRTTGFRIEYSTDGTTWSTAYTGTTIGSSKTITFTAVAGRYARIYFISGSANAPIIYEFEIYNTGTASRQANNIISLNEVENKKLMIYPNPVANQLIIKTPGGNINWNYKLYSVQGALLKSGFAHSGTIIINVKGYAVGTYLLQLRSSKGDRIVKRIIKE